MIIRIIHACFIYHYFSFRDIFTVEKCPVSHMKNSSSEYFQNLLLNKNAPIRAKASFFNGLYRYIFGGERSCFYFPNGTIKKSTAHNFGCTFKVITENCKPCNLWTASLCNF